MRRGILAAVITLAVLVHSIAAHATTHFVFSNGRLALMDVLGHNRIHAIAGYTESTNFLAYQDPNSDWAAVPNPPGVNSFYVGTGVVAVTPPSSWGPPRIFAIAASNGSTPAALYEIPFDSSGSPLPPISLGAPMSSATPDPLMKSPALDATFDALHGEIWLAIRAPADDNRIWSCRIAHSGDGCTWTDETCRGTGTCHLGIDGSPIAVNAPGLDGYREIYMITPASGATVGGALLRFRSDPDAGFAAWDSVGSGGTPLLATVDLVGIRPWTSGGSTRVAIAAWTGGNNDALEMATTTGQGWTWANLSLSQGGPPAGVSPSLGNIAHASNGTTDRIWFASGDGSLWWCQLSGTTCTWSPFGQPSDGRPGFDGVGGGIAATFDTAFITGSLGAPVEYVYAYTR